MCVADPIVVLGLSLTDGGACRAPPLTCIRVTFVWPVSCYYSTIINSTARRGRLFRVHPALQSVRWSSLCISYRVAASIACGAQRVWPAETDW